MVALGVLMSTFLIYRHAKLRKMQAEKIVDLIFWVVLLGLIGGRVFYVLLNFSAYRNNLSEIFMLHRGGLLQDLHPGGRGVRPVGPADRGTAESPAPLRRCLRAAYARSAI